MKNALRLAFVIFAFLILGISIVYRFVIFPVQKREECSYVKDVSVWTVADLQAAGMLSVFPTPIILPFPPPSTRMPLRNSAIMLVQPVQPTPIPATDPAEIKKNFQLRSACESENNKIIDEYVSHRVIEKITYTPATQQQYTNCLRDYGL